MPHRITGEPQLRTPDPEGPLIHGCGLACTPRARPPLGCCSRYRSLWWKSERIAPADRADSTSLSAAWNARPISARNSSVPASGERMTSLNPRLNRCECANCGWLIDYEESGSVSSECAGRVWCAMVFTPCGNMTENAPLDNHGEELLWIL